MFLSKDKNNILAQQTVKKPHLDELSNDLKVMIEKTLIQFQECSCEEDFDLFLTPLTMLLDIIDNNNDDDNKKNIPEILNYFEELYTFFFNLIETPQQDSDFYQKIIDLIAFITCYVDYSKYCSLISHQFIQNLFDLLANDSKLAKIIIILSNIFVEVDSDSQNFIISQFAILLDNFADDKHIKHKLFRFFYIVCKHSSKQQIEDNSSFILSFINQFISSFGQYNDKIYYSYYYSFFSFGNLIMKGIDVQLFIKPELISIYNKCLHSTLPRVLSGDFFVLNKIIDNTDNYDFTELIDYKQAIEIIFNKIQDEKDSDLKEKVILNGLYFLISSATCCNQIREYLFGLDLFQAIEHLFISSSFRIRSNLSYLYISLIPRNDFENRINLLKSQFFMNYILQLIDSYDNNTQRAILNIVYNTLLYCDSLGNKIYHQFLIENKFTFLVEDISFEDEASNSYVDKILNILQTVQY